MMYFSPLNNTSVNSSSLTDETIISLLDLASRAAHNGLFCTAEHPNPHPTAPPKPRQIPTWESWIAAASKRRALITTYFFTSIYNADRLLPEFVAAEMRDVFAPGNKVLWSGGWWSWGESVKRGRGWLRGGCGRRMNLG